MMSWMIYIVYIFGVLLCQHCQGDSDSMRRIIFDTDPGLDDAFALLWLIHFSNHNLIKIEAITTVGGNSLAFDTFRNMIDIINITRINGSDDHDLNINNIEFGKFDELSPLHKATKHDDFYGNDGLNGLSDIFYYDGDGYDDKKSKLNKISQMYNNSRYSQNIIIDLLLSNPFEITIICVGPLTNLGLAQQQLPGILTLAKEIIIMGGAIDKQHGNTVHLSEFNFMSDSSSLHVVLNAINQNYNQSPWNSIMEYVQRNQPSSPVSIAAGNNYSSQFGQILDNYIKRMDNTYGDFEDVVKIMNGLINRLPKPNVILFPLDITTTIKWTEKDLDFLDIGINSNTCARCTIDDGDSGSDTRRRVNVVRKFVEQSTLLMVKQHFLWGDGHEMYLHDPTTVGYLFYSKLFKLRNVFLQSFKNGQHGFVFYHNQLGEPKNGTLVEIPNVFYACNVDVEKFKLVFTRDIQQLLLDLDQI